MVRLSDWGQDDLPFPIIPELSHPELGFYATEKGLFWTDDGRLEWCSFEGYAQRLQVVGRAIHWVLGDFFNHAEMQWGEDYAQLADTTGYEAGTLYNDKYVCERVPMSIREWAQSFGHAQAVAGMGTVEDRERMLRQSMAEDWSRQELRVAVALIDGEQSEPQWSEPTGKGQPGSVAEVRERIYAMRDDLAEIALLLEDWVEPELAGAVREGWATLDVVLRRFAEQEPVE